MADLSTHDMIVQRADTLFYEAGYETTSFADIAASVGISRGNFYHHFKTKDDILAAVITLRHRCTKAMLAEWEADADTPLSRIFGFVRLLVLNRAKIMAHGCPVGTLCSELAKLDHAAQPEAAAIMALFRDWLAEGLALHLLNWSQGTAVLAATFRDEAYLRAEVDRIERWLVALPATDPF